MHINFFFTLFLLLIVAHVFGDFVFQTDAIANGKNRHFNPKLYGVNWWYWLSAHAIVQGFGVGLVTGSIGFGIAETVAHWCIDYGKCEGWYGIHIDQMLHIVCKFIWALLIVFYLGQI